MELEKIEGEMKKIYDEMRKLDKNKDKAKIEALQTQMKKLRAEYREAHKKAHGFEPKEWTLRLNIKTMLKRANINPYKTNITQKTLRYIRRRIRTMVKEKLLNATKDGFTEKAVKTNFGVRGERMKQRLEAKALKEIAKIETKLKIPLSEEQKQKIRERIYSAKGF